MNKEEELKLKMPLPKDPKKAFEVIEERLSMYPTNCPERLKIREQLRKYEKKIR